MPVEDCKLNDAHRRFLWAALCTVEERLERVESLLSQSETRGITYRVRNPYSAAKRERIRRELTTLKAALAQFQSDFGLPVNVEDLGQLLRGAVSGAWADLSECRSQYLQGYGSLPSATSNGLDARVEALLALLERLSETA